MKFKYIGVILLFATLALGSCSSGNNANDNKDKVTPQQLEEARMAGREAARVFVNKKWKDTLALQEQLIEANVQAAKFNNVPTLRAAYDTAFISTVRTVRPEIAAELEKRQKQMKK